MDEKIALCKELRNWFKESKSCFYADPEQGKVIIETRVNAFKREEAKALSSLQEIAPCPDLKEILNVLPANLELRTGFSDNLQEDTLRIKMEIVDYSGQKEFRFYLDADDDTVSIAFGVEEFISNGDFYSVDPEISSLQLLKHIENVLLDETLNK